MTKQEAIILSAYTGYLLVDNFDDVHEFIEKLLGRPVWTHQLADPELQKEIREKCKPILPRVSKAYGTGEKQACDKCEHNPVCGKFRATGGVKKCEHFKEDDEPAYGRWIERPLDNFRKYEVKCSECGFIGIGNYDQYLEPSDFNYCPNCGTDMRPTEDG